MIKKDFLDIIDELNWQAFRLTDGNIEAAKELVSHRNLQREKTNKTQNTQKKQPDREM